MDAAEETNCRRLTKKEKKKNYLVFRSNSVKTPAVNQSVIIGPRWESQSESGEEGNIQSATPTSEQQTER